MINLHYKWIINSYKRLYSKKIYSLNEAIMLFKKLYFLNKNGNIDISIKLKKKEKINFKINLNNITNKIIKSDKFGLINLNIGNLNSDIILKNNINHLIIEIKNFINLNNLNTNILSIFLSYNMIFGVFINLNN